MTGEEHYAKAEELLREYVDREPGTVGGTAHPTGREVAAAQVHATLALAAAQSHVPAQHGYPARERYGADGR